MQILWLVVMPNCVILLFFFNCVWRINDDDERHMAARPGLDPVGASTAEVMHIQCDARPTVTFPAEDITAV